MVHQTPGSCNGPPTPSAAPTLPFGRHRGKTLSDVPLDYLQWLLCKARLSSSLRSAVTGELDRRGAPAPPPRQPVIPPCPCCGVGDCHRATWQEDRNGNRRVRAECVMCGKFLTFLPAVEPYTGEADRNASPTPVLDALTRLGALGVELESDGRTVRLPWPESQRVPADLQALVRQCNHHLARLLGDTRKRAHA